MTMEKAQSNLSKYFPNNIFCNVILLLATAFDNLCEVPFFAVFHYNIDFCRLFVDYPIIITNDMRMIKLSKDIHLSYKLLLFFLSHLSICKFFPNHDTTISLPPNFANLTE